MSAIAQAIFGTRVPWQIAEMQEPPEQLPPIWKDTRTIPLYVTSASLLVLAIHWGLQFHSKRKGAESKTYNFNIPVLKKNLWITRILEGSRLAGCIALEVILVALAKHQANATPYWLLLSAIATTTILAVVALYNAGHSRSASYAVSLIHFSALAVFTYRDVFPFAYARPVRYIAQNDAVLFWTMFGILAYTGLFIPLSLPRFVMYDDPESTEEPNPSQVSSIGAFWMHSYIDPLIWKGYKKSTLEVSDLPSIRAVEKAEVIKKIGYPYLDPLLNGPRWRFFRGMFGYIKYDMLGMLICMTVSIINDFAIPLATLNILAFLEDPDPVGRAQPWAWIIWLALGPVIGACASQVSLFIKTHMNVRLEALLTQLIFDHAIRVRVNPVSTELEKDKLEKEKDAKKKEEERIKKQKAKGTPTATPPPERANGSGNGNGNGNGSVSSDQASVSSSTAVGSVAESSTAKNEPPKKNPSKEVSNQAGSISNLLTVDAKNVSNLIEQGGFRAFIGLIVSFVLLYNILGWSSLIGAAFLVISLPVPAYLVKFRSSVQKKQMKKADERLQTVTQVMNVLRMVKLFGWEAKIEEKIKEKRTAELRYIWLSDILDTGSTYIVGLFPLGAMLGTYTCYTLVMGLPLRASLIFSSIALFDMLRRNMMMLSYYIPWYIKGKVSGDRLATFLKSGELLPPPQQSNAAGIQVSIRDTEFTWNALSKTGEEDPTERKFHLRIEGELKFETGKINLITGPTGCGKTSLLMSLLGEMVATPLSENHHYILSRDGGVAYAAQESWVLNDTIKENILFGSELDEERYQKVIRQCALETDLSLFEAGDMTEVGEKGITLSGGQKARITLARAVYSKAAVLLLDDILSALDVHTARWVVDHCLGGSLLKDRTVLLVTHNVVLAQTVADFVVLLNLNGTVKSQGPISDVIRQDSTLRNAVANAVDEQKENVDVTEEEKKAKAKTGKLIVAEEMALGHVGWPAYKLYLTSLGGPVFYLAAYGFLLFANFAPLIQKAFLAYWSRQYEEMPVEDVEVRFYLVVYGLLCLGGSLIGFVSWIVYLYGIIRASANIHAELVHSIMTSTLRWLDTTPVSRVLTRCSQDIEAVDNWISGLLINVVSIGTTIIITSSTVVVVAGWPMLLPSLAIVTLGLIIGHIYMTAQLPVKRLMSNAKAPILAHIQTALAGLVSVRAYGAQPVFQADMRKRLDTYSIISHPYWDINRWIAVRIELLGSFFSGTVAAWLIYGNHSSSSAIGFTLVLISSFNTMLLHWVRMFNQLEIQANSLERIRDFLAIEHEPKATEDGKPPAYWPASGALHVEGLSARYSKDGPEVLKDVSFTVNSGERVGVVGRTGAGKSSLGLALLRAIPTTGSVLFDGLDTHKMNLDALRGNLSIIPQSPELLAGTLRENLDPLEEHDDAVLNDALQQAGLSHLKVDGESSQSDITLDSKVESSGSNFSQGQRQIIALARAFVRRTKILIMDEATAAIDYETDHLIQQFIRSEFKDVTVITVAHRLQTIMNSDKILVLDEGRVKEWGSPKELLLHEGSAFKSLVDESSDKKELYQTVGLES